MRYDKGQQKAKTALREEFRRGLQSELDLGRGPATSKELEGLLPEDISSLPSGGYVPKQEQYKPKPQ